MRVYEKIVLPGQPLGVFPGLVKKLQMLGARIRLRSEEVMKSGRSE